MSREDRAAETFGHLFGGGEAHGRLTGGAGAYGPAVVVFLYQLLQERVARCASIRLGGRPPHLCLPNASLD